MARCAICRRVEQAATGVNQCECDVLHARVGSLLTLARQHQHTIDLATSLKDGYREGMLVYENAGFWERLSFAFSPYPLRLKALRVANKVRNNED